MHALLDATGADAVFGLTTAGSVYQCSAEALLAGQSVVDEADLPAQALDD